MGRQRRTRKQNSKLTAKPERSNTYQQRITSFLQRKYKADPGAGHKIQEKKNQKDIRIMLQNPNGVMTYRTFDDKCSLQEYKDLEADVIGLPETNRNWNQPYNRDRWKVRVQSV